MRVTVTGGSGFIGSAVCDELRWRDMDPRPFDRVHGNDVLDFGPGDCGDAVIHLAGALGTAELFDDPYGAIETNIVGSMRVIDACAKAGVPLVQITMPSIWRNVYQATKRCAVDLADAWQMHRGLQVTHVCAFNVYGPGQHVLPVRKFLPTFATAAWRDRPIQIWGDGQQMMDVVHVQDTAVVLVEALTRCPHEGETLEAGSGVGTSVLAVAEAVRDHVGRGTSIEMEPMRAGEHRSTPPVADTTALRRYGIQVPSPLNLGTLREDGRFTEAVEWYREDRP